MTSNDHSQDNVLQTKDLRYSYGAHEAVRGIDLSVMQGEVFALLGTNGAGKTTTLEILEGHRPPSAGYVRVLGLDPERHRRRLASNTAVMFQEPSTPDDLTPTETLVLWAQLIGGEKPTGPDVDEHLARVDLLHRRDVLVGQLSGGERRRLDLAIALTGEPELLLLDEPTTGLDPESRVRTWQTIRDVVAKGSTVLLTTHYLEEAEAVADRLAILHEGKVALSGTLEEVRSQRSARIRCVLPAERPDAQPPAMSGEVQLNSNDHGRELTITTDALQHDLTTLLVWAADESLQLRGLHASAPSLSEVFHSIHDRPEAEGEKR